VRVLHLRVPECKGHRCGCRESWICAAGEVACAAEGEYLRVLMNFFLEFLCALEGEVGWISLRIIEF